MGFFTSFQLKSRDAGTRRRAALSLGVRGRTAAIASLVPLLDDPEWPVRQAAIEALGLVADAAAAPLLTTAIRQADQVRDPAGAAALRAAAVEAFGRIGAPGLSVLQEALRDRHAKLRETAIEALAAIGGPEAVASLAATLDDERSSVRQAAAAAISRAGGAAAVPALRRALEHKDPTTRKGAAEALGEVRGDAAADAVRAALADRDRAVREAGVRALAAIGTPGAVTALIAGMHDGDRDLRASIASALESFEWTPAGPAQRVVHAALHGRFDEAAAEGAIAVDPLMAALASREPSARRGAVAALGRLGDPRASAAIAASFRDTDASVREAAADALAAIGPGASGAILDALRDRTATVRSAADRALSRIGGGPIAAALVAGLAAGQPARHGSTDLRIVSTRADLDAAREAADALDTLLAHAIGKLPVDALRPIATVADVLRIEPGEVPGDSDRLALDALRDAARQELTRRGV